jgi:hypothetical protein
MTDPDDVLDFSGTPRSLGEQRDHGFAIMKQRMMEIKVAQLGHVPKLTRSTAIKFYEQGLVDAFNVFAQVVDVPSEEELTPG